MIRSIGLFFFILLSIYLPKHFPAILPIIIFIFGLSIAHQVFRLAFPLWKKNLVFIIILGLIILGEKDYLCMVFAALLLHSVFLDNGRFRIIAFSMAPLILIFEILGFWGIPFNIWLIWFWGLPFVFVTTLIVGLGKPKIHAPIFISMILGLLLIFNQILLYSLDPAKIRVVKSDPDSKIDGPSQNLIKNLSDKASLIDPKEAINSIEHGGEALKWLIMSPSTPKINDLYIKSKVNVGEYYVFGEHDDLGGFVKPGSLFNIDSFARRGPWHSFRPLMVRSIKVASDQDPVYSSNIGCTLRQTTNGYPLIWDYTVYGVPKLLARGEFHFSWRMTCVGESDPIAKPLVSYNPNFLQAILNQPNLADIWKGVLLEICAIFLLLYKKLKVKFEVIVVIVALCGIVTANFGPFYKDKPNTPVDVSILIYGPWLSPHYESHYSSLAKMLSQKDLTISINKPDRPSKLSIIIIDTEKKNLSAIKEYSSNRKIVFLTPKAIIRDREKTFKVEDVPLGDVTKEVYGKRLSINDARRIIIDTKPVDCSISINDNLIIIATNSPQLTKGIESLVTDEF